MDNGCNFAAALAGICELLDHKFFTAEIPKIKVVFLSVLSLKLTH